MAEIKLTAETGRALGSRSSNRLRAEGKIPAVIYGHGSDPIPVSVVWRELRTALSTDAGLNALLDLEVGGDAKLAIVKDLQRHPLRHNVTHIDFLLVNRDEQLSIEVPIIVQGEALEVTREHGIADQIAFMLTVNAKPADIPNELIVDISGLTLGESIRVGDIALPPGVTTDVDLDEPVVVTAMTREEAPAEAATEGEEGEAADDAAKAAEGDAAEG